MSLYRKYRPQTFEDVVGQEHVARTLRNALTAQPPRVAHAYLFTGPRGIGKTTNARLMAKCLNCETGPTATPCNKCDFCVRVANNQPVMDMIEIDAASHTGVDNIREVIIDKVNVAPAQGRYRIYVIDEVHMLSTSSFNALLKTLEEPPAHAVFILATTDSHKVPPTILSRCQRFDFRRVGVADIVKRLHFVARSEGLTLQEEAARLIARHAEGALRDALTLLEQVSAYAADEITAADVRLVLGGVPEELLHELVEAVGVQDPRRVLYAVENAVEEGASFAQLSRDLMGYCRDLLLVTVGYAAGELTPEEMAMRQKHARELGRGRIEALMAGLREAEKEMRLSTDHRLLLELTLVRATGGDYGAAPVQATPVTRPRPSAPEVAPPRPQPQAETPPPIRIVKDEALAPVETPVREVPVDESEPPLEQLAMTAPPEEDETEVVAAQPEMPVEVVEAVEEAVVEAPAKPRKQGRRISNYEEMLELWPSLLMRMRKKMGIPVISFLGDARPVRFDDESVVFEFQREFHLAKTKEALGRLPIEDSINEVLDKPRRIRFELMPPAAKQAPPPEPEADPDDDEDDLEMDIVEYTQSIFAAEIMGRSG